MEEPHLDVNNIGNLDKYIGVTAKKTNETNNGSNIATLKRRTTDSNGFTIGRAQNNPLLDTQEYEVELEDGTSDSFP